MDKIIDIVKAHPLAIGAGVVVLLLLLKAGGSSSSSGSGNAGPMIAASLQSQGIASDLSKAVNGVNAQVSIANAGFASANYQAGIKAASDISKNDTAAMIAAYTTMVGSGDNRAAFDLQKTLGLASINSGQVVALDNNQTQLKGLNATIQRDLTSTGMVLAAGQAINFDNNQTKLTSLDKSLSTAKDITYNNNYTALTAQDKQYEFQVKSMPQLLQHSENVARITGATQTELARVNGATQQNLAQTNTSAARTNAETKQQGSLLDTVINLAGSFFGF